MQAIYNQLKPRFTTMTPGWSKVLLCIMAVLFLGAAWLIPRTILYHYRPAVLDSGPGRFDFGIVDAGTIVSHSFIVKNSGGRRIKITKVTPSCSCTIANITKTDLNPGESAALVVNLDTSSQFGAVSKDVVIFSDSLSQTATRLVLSGEVRFAFNPNSKAVDFQWNKTDSNAVSSFAIELNGRARGTHFKVDAESIPNYLSLSLSYPDPGKCNVTIRMDLRSAPERFASTVLLKPDSGFPFSPYPLYLKGERSGLLQCIPDELYFGVVVPGRQYTRRVTLYVTGGKLNQAVSEVGAPQVSDNSVHATIERTGDITYYCV
jgi:hypothetical protein